MAKPFSPKNAALGPDYAELVFELGLEDTVSMGSAKTQEYRISKTDRFHDGQLVKLFTWAARKPKSILHPAGRRIFVFGRMNRLFGAPGISSSGQNWCMNGSSFTPRPHTRYRIVQKGSPYGSCEITVTDLATGLQPQDVERVMFPPAVVPPEN